MERKKLVPDKEAGEKTCLIDGDILLYRIGFAYEDQPEDKALEAISTYVDEIVRKSGCSDYEVFLTDSKGNFRNAIYPGYKKNRVQPKPTHYPALKRHLLSVNYAIIAVGEEADDLLGIYQNANTVIATIDKDLDQVEGQHYNFVKDKLYRVTEDEGRHKFWQQMLTGDRVDNIPGIMGIGPVKAEKIITGCVTDKEYAEAILGAYLDTGNFLGKDGLIDWLNVIGKLLYIRRKPNEMWEWKDEWNV